MKRVVMFGGSSGEAFCTVDVGALLFTQKLPNGIKLVYSEKSVEYLKVDKLDNADIDSPLSNTIDKLYNNIISELRSVQTKTVIFTNDKGLPFCTINIGDLVFSRKYSDVCIQLVYSNGTRAKISNEDMEILGDEYIGKNNLDKIYKGIISEMSKAEKA